MIRLVTGLFAFAVVLCALIILKPFAEQRARDEVAAAAVEAPVMVAAAQSVDTALPEFEVEVTAPQVTRASGATTLTEAEAAERAAAMIAYTESLPQAEEMAPAPVTATPIPGRTATPATFGHQDAPAPRASPALAIRTDETSLGETTAAVLAGLGLQGAAPEAAEGSLRDLTAGALTGIRSATGNTAAPVEPRTALQALVVDALQQGQTDSYIDALLNEAAAAGTISVPEILVTADGRVDTAVLLSSIVADARVAQGGAAPAAPESVGGTGVEVRIVQTATEAESFRFYTVSPGDSLGAIAVKFYGEVRNFELIFNANRDILSSPDRIMVGQRLVIPDLPEA